MRTIPRPAAILAPAFLLSGLVASPASADEMRAMAAHVHGVGELQIAFDEASVAMHFEAPAADIAGFEHAPRTDDQRRTVAEAIAALAEPASLFALPAAAGCTVIEARASLVGAEAEADDAHDHGEAHAHEDGHAHGDDHAHDDAHAHDDGHAHDEHHGDGHHGDGHAEFHADYLLTCEDPSAIDRIEFVYFERFPNARKVETVVIGDAGGRRFDATREAPDLRLEGVL